MVDLPKKKIGIVACSGEELPEGAITRLAALQVLEQLRPNDTVTICLPLFLAGGEGDRAFARFYPTISVDGCELRCAQRATEKYSNKPAVSIVVSDLIEQNRLGQVEGLRKLNPAGRRAVEITAEAIASSADDLLGITWSRAHGEIIELEMLNESQPGLKEGPAAATCACASGIPVQSIIISGKEVKLAGLLLIFQQFAEAGKTPTDANLAEMLEVIKVYNPIPMDEESAYREGIRKAYTSYWFKEREL